MRRAFLIVNFLVICTFSMWGQNYMGKSKKEILKCIGKPDSIGHNYLVYQDLAEKGVNIYYFDNTDKCKSFEIIRNNTHLDEYQRILNREFTEISSNKFVKKTRKINFVADLTISDETFQIKIQDNLGPSGTSATAFMNR